MATLADKKRAFYSEALGLSDVGNMSITDLENRFFNTASGAGGAYRYGFTAKKLPKWQVALARVRDNAGDAKLLCVGDSQYFGVGSTLSGTFPSTGAPVSRLATIMNTFVPTSFGFIAPGVDQRWTVAANWTSTFFGFGSLACYTSAVNAGTLVCTDTRTNWDRCDIYYLQGPGLGTVACTATGGSAVNGVGANASSSIQKVTALAAAPATSNTISIVATVAQCYVVGVEFWLNGTSKIRLGNGGVGTTGAQQHVLSPTTWGTIPTINAYQPDLTIFGLGVNDRGASRTVNQYKTDMQTLITAAKLVSDVVLASEMPTGQTPQSTNEASYNTALSELANDNALAYYAYCERCQSFSSYNALGFTSDNLHGNNKAYWDWAAGIAPVLMGI